jgi:hypothetical protein
MYEKYSETYDPVTPHGSVLSEEHKKRHKQNKLSSGGTKKD